MRRCAEARRERIAAGRRRRGRSRRPGARNESGKTPSLPAEIRLPTHEDCGCGVSREAAAEAARQAIRHPHGRADREPIAGSRWRRVHRRLPVFLFYADSRFAGVFPLLSSRDQCRAFLLRVPVRPEAHRSQLISRQSNPCQGEICVEVLELLVLSAVGLDG